MEEPPGNGKYLMRNTTESAVRHRKLLGDVTVVAGNTGTASIPVKGHYDPNSTITSFIGFAPAEKPKFIMLVILEKPATSIYAAETAAPIFFDIARDLLSYYGIPPTE